MVWWLIILLSKLLSFMRHLITTHQKIYFDCFSLFMLFFRRWEKLDAVCEPRTFLSNFFQQREYQRCIIFGIPLLYRWPQIPNSRYFILQNTKNCHFGPKYCNEFCWGPNFMRDIMAKWIKFSKENALFGVVLRYHSESKIRTAVSAFGSNSVNTFDERKKV